MKVSLERIQMNELGTTKTTIMQLSDKGIELIKTFEGFSAIPYNDVVGRPTIGFGHLILPGEVFGSIGSMEATSLLRKDCSKAVSCVNNNVKVQLNQNQFDALVSFTYNLGCGNFKSSTLLKYVNLGNFQAAAAEFHKWNHAGGKVVDGLTKRRNKEAQLFLKEV